MLGFRDNEDYRASNLWKRIKRRILKRDSDLCKCCGGKATIVHHRSYALQVLEGKDDEQLASICEGCHDFIHWDDSHAWRPMKECEKFLQRGRHSTDFPVPTVDLRKKSPQYPLEWPRMSAVQRCAWNREHQRLSFLFQLQKQMEKPKLAETFRRLLREWYGMDEAAIAAELALVQRMRTTARKKKSQKAGTETKTTTPTR